MLGVDFGNGCREAGLDGGKTLKVGEIADVVGKGVGCKDLFRDRSMAQMIQLRVVNTKNCRVCTSESKAKSLESIASGYV